MTENIQYGILPVKVVIDTHGAVTYEPKTTDHDYKRIVGFAVTFDDATNQPGSTMNIRIGGKSIFRKNIETKLFTFNSACPVNDRYYNFINEPVNNSLIQIEYTPGAAFPAGDTTVVVFFQCTYE